MWIYEVPLFLFTEHVCLCQVSDVALEATEPAHNEEKTFGKGVICLYKVANQGLAILFLRHHLVSNMMLVLPPLCFGLNKGLMYAKSVFYHRTGLLQLSPAPSSMSLLYGVIVNLNSLRTRLYCPFLIQTFLTICCGGKVNYSFQF